MNKNTEAINLILNERILKISKILESSEVKYNRILFNSNELLDQEKITLIHDKFPRENQGKIYLHHIQIEDKKYSQKIRSAFKNQSNGFNFSRNNVNHNDSSSIYIGTSRNLYDRFRTHLGKGKGKTTWALYLSAWTKTLGLNFIVEYHEFNNTPPEDIEIIEAFLWDNFQPLFGKKGSL